MVHANCVLCEGRFMKELVYFARSLVRPKNNGFVICNGSVQLREDASPAKSLYRQKKTM